MTWPTVPVSTTNTDASSDSPANARADILDLQQKVNEMIAVEPVGRLIGVRLITSNGTYTPTAGTKFVIVEAIGGGGGGCGGPVPISGRVCVTPGGQGGAYAKVLVTSGFSGVSVTVGVAGNGGDSAGSTPGSDGGASSFGALIYCPGGKGGTTHSSKWSVPYIGTSSDYIATGPANVGLDGIVPTISVGDGVILQSLRGRLANSGIAQLSSATGFQQTPAYGGDSPIGSAYGGLKTGYGCGGDGVIVYASAVAKAGQSGGVGVVIVWEYS